MPGQVTARNEETKAPWEERDFWFDLTARLPTGVTIAQVISIEATRTDGAASDLVIGANVVDGTGKLVKVRLSAGTNGKDYVVSCKMLWSDSQKREAEGILMVREAG